VLCIYTYPISLPGPAPLSCPSHNFTVLGPLYHLFPLSFSLSLYLIPSPLPIYSFLLTLPISVVSLLHPSQFPISPSLCLTFHLSPFSCPKAHLPLLSIPYPFISTPTHSIVPSPLTSSLPSSYCPVPYPVSPSS
jgi:hypothetical protein